MVKMLSSCLLIIAALNLSGCATSKTADVPQFDYERREVRPPVYTHDPLKPR